MLETPADIEFLMCSGFVELQLLSDRWLTRSLSDSLISMLIQLPNLS